jgi:hypothetical protein
LANWLWSIPPHNYKACVESQTFAVRTAGKAAVQRIEPGDGIFAYLPGPKVVAGMFRADTPYLHSEELIWPDGVYPHRIRVIPEVVLAEVQRVPLDDFKNRLQVGEKYPNFGLVIQKVVHELSDDDAAVLEALVRENAQSTGEPPSSSGDVVELEGAAVRDDDEAQSPPVASNDKSNEALIRDLHRAQQRIGLLQREVKDLEMLLALAGPNLEDYLRLAHSSEGPAFEEATRRCLVALGFIMDSDYVGQAGQIDFVAESGAGHLIALGFSS